MATPSTYGSSILASELIDLLVSGRNESGDAFWIAFMYPRILLYLQNKTAQYGSGTCAQATAVPVASSEESCGGQCVGTSFVEWKPGDQSLARAGELLLRERLENAERLVDPAADGFLSSAISSEHVK